MDKRLNSLDKEFLEGLIVGTANKTWLMYKPKQEHDLWTSFVSGIFTDRGVVQGDVYSRRHAKMNITNEVLTRKWMQTPGWKYAEKRLVRLVLDNSIDEASSVRIPHGPYDIAALKEQGYSPKLATLTDKLEWTGIKVAQGMVFLTLFGGGYLTFEALKGTLPPEITTIGSLAGAYWLTSKLSKALGERIEASINKGFKAPKERSIKLESLLKRSRESEHDEDTKCAIEKIEHYDSAKTTVFSPIKKEADEIDIIERSRTAKLHRHRKIIWYDRTWANTLFRQPLRGFKDTYMKINTHDLGDNETIAIHNRLIAQVGDWDVKFSPSRVDLVNNNGKILLKPALDVNEYSVQVHLARKGILLKEMDNKKHLRHTDDYRERLIEQGKIRVFDMRINPFTHTMRLEEILGT